MVVLEQTLILVSLAVFAAHYLRVHDRVVVGSILLVMGISLVPRPWALPVVQGTLAFAVIEWCRTLFEIARRRRRIGQPMVRMSVILGTVVLVTLLATWSVRSTSMLHFYGVN